MAVGVVVRMNESDAVRRQHMEQKHLGICFNKSAVTVIVSAFILMHVAVERATADVFLFTANQATASAD